MLENNHSSDSGLSDCIKSLLVIVGSHEHGACSMNLSGAARPHPRAVYFVSQKQQGGQSRHCAVLCYTVRSRVRCRGQRDDYQAACEANP